MIGNGWILTLIVLLPNIPWGLRKKSLEKDADAANEEKAPRHHPLLEILENAGRFAVFVHPVTGGSGATSFTPCPSRRLFGFS